MNEVCFTNKNSEDTFFFKINQELVMHQNAKSRLDLHPKEKGRGNPSKIKNSGK